MEPELWNIMLTVDYVWKFGRRPQDDGVVLVVRNSCGVKLHLRMLCRSNSFCLVVCRTIDWLVVHCLLFRCSQFSSLCVTWK